MPSLSWNSSFTASVRPDTPAEYGIPPTPKIKYGCPGYGDGQGGLSQAQADTCWLSAGWCRARCRFRKCGSRINIRPARRHWGHCAIFFTATFFSLTEELPTLKLSPAGGHHLEQGRGLRGKAPAAAELESRCTCFTVECGAHCTRHARSTPDPLGSKLLSKRFREKRATTPTRYFTEPVRAQRARSRESPQVAYCLAAALDFSSSSRSCFVKSSSGTSSSQSS